MLEDWKDNKTDHWGSTEGDTVPQQMSLKLLGPRKLGEPREQEPDFQGAIPV